MQSKGISEPDHAAAADAAAFSTMRRELAALGLANLEIVVGASADPDVPSSPATWHARVREPHPFTPPRRLGTHGELEALGFGDATAIAPVRAAVVAHWPPAMFCTGLVIEFSEPRATVRLPVRTEHGARETTDGT